MHQHLIFYDGTCGFCKSWVQFALKYDTQKIFDFAPLQGETAKRLLKKIPLENSLVLLENYRSKHPSTYQLAKGSFRILWLMGGFWKALGWISFLPGFLYNWSYRLVANHRHRFKGFSEDSCPIFDPKQDPRFLP